MHKVFSRLDSERVEVKYYGPFPRNLNEILGRLNLNKVLFGKKLSIYVNGTEVIDNISLDAPCFIEIFFSQTESVFAGSPKPEINTAEKSWTEDENRNEPFIVWEDESLAVVFKPALMATQPTRLRHEPNLRDKLKDILSPGYHIPSRLDYGVSGLILVSKSSKSHKFVHNLYAKRSIQKFYALLSENSARWRYFFFRSDIVKSQLHSALRDVAPGDSAETLFCSVDRTHDLFLYVARPYTGRTHQIRVHAKHIGIPIHGDPFYSNPSHSGIKLVCFCLRFQYKNEIRQVYPPNSVTPSWLDLELLKAREYEWLL